MIRKEHEPQKTKTCQTEQELIEVLNAQRIDLVLVTDNTSNPGELEYKILPAGRIEMIHTIHARVQVALLQRNGNTIGRAIQITANAAFSLVDDSHLARLLSDYFNSEQALSSQDINVELPIRAQQTDVTIEIIPFNRRTIASETELTQPLPPLNFYATAT